MIKLDPKYAALMFAGLMSGGCAMFSSTADVEDLPPPPPPAQPTTVPAEGYNDTSTPGGLAREIFIEFPRRISELATGNTPTVAAIGMEDQSPDRRRDGINSLVDRNFGKQAPYTDRYQQIAEFDNDPSVRAAAIRALNRSRDGNAGRIFIAGLADDNAGVRLEAAKALSNVPTEGSAPGLIKLAASSAEPADVRIAAADALRHYRSLEVARALINLLSDRDFSVSWQSRQSLRYMTGGDQRYDQTAWLNYVTGPEKPLG